MSLESLHTCIPAYLILKVQRQTPPPSSQEFQNQGVQVCRYASLATSWGGPYEIQTRHLNEEYLFSHPHFFYFSNTGNGNKYPFENVQQILSQRSKNKATTVTEWPLCRQDTSMKSIYSPFQVFSILVKFEMAKNIHFTCADKTTQWRVSILPSPFFLF